MMSPQLKHFHLPLLSFLFCLLLRSSSVIASTESHTRAFTLNGFNFTVISDGSHSVCSDLFFRSPSPSDSDSNSKSNFTSPLLHALHDTDSPLPLSSNILIVDVQWIRVLIDTGHGPASSHPSTGRLLARMADAGLPADSIDAILLTHGHHGAVSGLVTEEGDRVFKKADVYVLENEHEFWMYGEGENAKVNINLEENKWKEMSDLYRRSLAPYVEDDCLFMFKMNDIPIRNIQTLHAPGHAPGHVAVQISKNESSLLVVGDLVHSHKLQFTKLNIGTRLDTNLRQAAHSRREVLRKAADEELLVLSRNIEFPGLGYVRRKDGAFEWTAVKEGEDLEQRQNESPESSSSSSSEQQCGSQCGSQ